MREIKFRAWHKKDKIILDWFIISQSVFSKELLYSILITDKDLYIVMQCIGLKDKNRKDIYDGDILSKDPFLKVIFNDGGFGFHNPINSGSDRLSQERVSRLEIIGNIYENPELL